MKILTQCLTAWVWITVLLAAHEATAQQSLSALTNAGGTPRPHPFSGIFPLPGGEQFVKVNTKDPRYLQLQDGTTFIPVGPNICWPRFETDEDTVMAHLERQFKALSDGGANYTRIWLSAPFYDPEHARASTFDEVLAGRVDRVIRLAVQYGIKVKFCFEHFRDLENMPSRFAGSVPFDKPIYHVRNGGPLRTMNEYFETPAGRNLFISRLEFFASRYAREPAVFGWELWNEINAVRVDNKPAVLLEWTAGMLKEADRKFPRHLVMQSLGSFDGPQSKDMYLAFSRLPGNEIAQVHRYLDPGAALPVCRGPMDVLAADAVKVLLDANLKKPVILSEVGAVEANHAGPSKLYEADSAGVLLHDLLFAPFFSGAAAPGQSWHWHYYLDKQNLWWHYGRFTNAIKGVDPVRDLMNPKYAEDDDLRMYGLVGKNQALIWCRDTASDWNAELVRGYAAQPMKNKTISLADWNLTSANVQASCYLPWADQWVAATVSNGNVYLPEFTRSIVVKLERK